MGSPSDSGSVWGKVDKIIDKLERTKSRNCEFYNKNNDDAIDLCFWNNDSEIYSTYNLSYNTLIIIMSLIKLYVLI